MSDVPGRSRAPATLYAAPSPAAKPSPLTSTDSFVRAEPSYSFSDEPDVRISALFVILRIPGFAVTANWPVTSFPASSVTEGTPAGVTSYSPASVAEADAVRPLTVYG